MYLYGVIDKLLACGSALDLVTLVQVFQQLCSSSLGHAVLEIGTDICGAVWTILLAQVIEYQGRGLLRIELCLFIVFVGGRHVVRVNRKSGCSRPVVVGDCCDVRRLWFDGRGDFGERMR